MPTTVFIEFDSPAPVEATPRRLHAAWGRVLDLPEGVSPERARSLPALAPRPPHALGGPKPYCVGQTTASGRTYGFELRFLDDRLVDTLDGWLTRGGVLPVGDGGRSTVALAARSAQVVEHRTWAELEAQDTDTSWVVRLLTPTVFSSRGRHVPGVSPASLAASLHARWCAYSPTGPLRLPDRQALAEALTTVDRTEPVEVGLAMPRGDGRGRLSANRIVAYTGELRISARPGATAQVLSRLMALACFTNAGSHTAYGMGVVDVEAGAQSGGDAITS